jgi:subtilisin family serine protease
MRARAGVRGVVASLAGALLATRPSLGIAQARLDAAFVDLLAPPGAGRHPLVDGRGKLPVVVELPVFANARAMGLLPLARGLATVRLAPNELARFESSHPDLRFSIWPPLHPVLDESAKLNGTLAYRAALGAAGSTVSGTGKGVVVGIVDSGIDAAHPDFRDELGHSRVAWMLDFSHLPVGLHPDVEAAFGCTDVMQSPCAVLAQADIDTALAGGPGASYVPRDLLGHGTHVASIAAGNGGGGASARFVGGAPEATLVIANVAHGPAGDSTDVDIVAGTRFVFDRAALLGLPAVSNLSLGSDYGPHDGTTPLEKALAEMVGPSQPGRAIVVAAGNSGSVYQGDQPDQRFGIHTQSRVTAGVAARSLLKGVSDGNQDKLTGSVSLWLRYGSGDEIAVGLEGPGGLSIPPVKFGTKGSASTPDNSLRGAIYNGVVDPAESLTADTRGAIVVWEGAWPADGEMTLRFEGEGFVDAWVEAQPDGVTGNFTEYFELATREGTVNVPATSADLIAVGCTVNRTTWTDGDGLFHDVTNPATLASRDGALLAPSDSSCFFSSAGPTATGAAKPEISAPGAEVVAAMSADAVPGMGQSTIFDAPSGVCPDGNACFVVDARHAVLSGSSMAAPQVAGAIALLFERDATLTEPEALLLLQQGARRPSGKVSYDFQLGVGALAVDGAMSALEARATAIAREPDASNSWMSLSAGTARPDAEQPVTGSVEVRANDGSIADGFDAGRLTLEVSAEGAVTKPLSRTAPGLYRFEVRALPGTGTRAIDLDVRLDGASIGQRGTRLSGSRSVPIGADRWIALGSARVYGGCTVPNARPSGGWESLLIALGALAVRRKRMFKA